MMSGLKNLDQGRWFFCTVNLFFFFWYSYCTLWFWKLNQEEYLQYSGFPIVGYWEEEEGRFPHSMNFFERHSPPCLPSTNKACIVPFVFLCMFCSNWHNWILSNVKQFLTFSFGLFHAFYPHYFVLHNQHVFLPSTMFFHLPCLALPVVIDCS